MMTRSASSLRCMFVAVSTMAIAILSAAGTSMAQLSDPAEPRPGSSTTDVVAYPRLGYVWPYASGPFYGKNETRSSLRDADVIHTAVGSFRLGAGKLNLPDELTATRQLDLVPYRYFVVQFESGAGPSGDVKAIRAAIEKHGGAVIGPLPVLAVVARLNAAALAAVDDAPGVRSVEPYHPAFKLDPAIGRTPLRNPVKALSEVYDLEILLFDGEDPRAVAGSIAALGGNVISVGPRSLRVELHRSRLADLAALEPIQRVFEYVPIRPHAEETTTTVQTGRWGYGIRPYTEAGIDGGNLAGFGGPQVLMMLDSGIQLDAPELADTWVTPGTPGPAHRKVLLYQPTDPFGGSGDDLGCDLALQGGFTHGHVVAATALGWASSVDPAFGPPFWAPGPSGSQWSLDGVAPRALLVAYDAQVTPWFGACNDPMLDTLDPGTLYGPGPSGSLADGHGLGARVVNFSWGAPINVYSPDAVEIDDFLSDNHDTTVLVSAGNEGADADLDGVPDPASLSSPATTKNGLAIGASANANDPGWNGSPADRADFSALGPVANTGRIAPQLMAPGVDTGTLGLESEFACTTGTNNQAAPVVCKIVSGLAGTSYAAAAASGAALLTRDYFTQGFHPDGTSLNPDNSADATEISGAAVKALLIASAEFMTGSNLTEAYRFNNQQGYGRIQLDNVLPLENWSATLSRLLVVDGGIPGGLNDLLQETSGTIDTLVGETQTATFEVCDDSQELRVVLAWLDEVDASAAGFLVNDLDLELVAPDSTTYFGNYFTDDDNRDGQIDFVPEDCPSVEGLNGTLDAAAWSLPACRRQDSSFSPPDGANPAEAIMLSPDYHGDGADDLDPADDNQIQTGSWTLTIRSSGLNPAQSYAVILAGGLCGMSKVELDRADYLCNDTLQITVHESDDLLDPANGLTPQVISDRVTVQVLDGLTLVDEERGIGFSPGPAVLSFSSQPVTLSDGTHPHGHNGLLEVRDGQTVRVIYADEEAGTPVLELRREALTLVSCGVRFGIDDAGIRQFGRDTVHRVVGGCERSARNLFEYGFPDRYLDAGETVVLQIAFVSLDDTDLADARVGLRCVWADDNLADEDCRPGDEPRVGCQNPDRGTDGGHVSCDPSVLEILGSPVYLGQLPAASRTTANFGIRMGNVIAGEPEVELVLDIEADGSGKSATGTAVVRHKLDVDENSTFYSTDFPYGGVYPTEVFDRNNNEYLDMPGTDLVDPDQDYRFDAVVYGDLTYNGSNLSLNSPWNFDVTDGGFLTGVGAPTDYDTISDVITQWGEDLNFNGVEDFACSLNPGRSCMTHADCQVFNEGNCVSLEDRGPANGRLDRNWSTNGGCGWQTKAPFTCSTDPSQGCYIDEQCPNDGPCNGPAPDTGGIWHTGDIGNTTDVTCLYPGDEGGQCQVYETISGTGGDRVWFELLHSPELQKVNGDDYTVEITNWAWNQQADLADNLVAWTWEFDTDTREPEPVDLVADLEVLNLFEGPYGAIRQKPLPPPQSIEYTVFSPPDSITGHTRNGTKGGNRYGDLGCAFVLPGSRHNLGLPLPPDDDVNNGYCEYDQNVSCSYLCSTQGPGAFDVPCSVNPDCVGTCVGNQCSNAWDVSCATPADCNFGTCGDRDCHQVCGPQNECTIAGTPCANNLDCQFACVRDNDEIDEYVGPHGPIRNMNISAVGGPDMRFNTLEDMYGDTGEHFAAAVGFLNYEKALPGDDDPVSGYGLAIDDMVIEWREYTLVTDTTDCFMGSCASLTVQASTLYGLEASVSITLLESTPPPVNDCDLDGTPDGTTDCNGNLVRDLVVRATSEAEPGGEIAYLDAVGGGNEYRANLPYSVNRDVAGVLLVHSSGGGDATITVTYDDADDGTGVVCQNGPSSATWGIVQAAARVPLTTGKLTVIGSVLSDNGDHDVWADTHETVDLYIRLFNESGIPVTGVVAGLSTDDPNIDCISQPYVHVGAMAAGQVLLSPQPFRFRVGDVDRASLGLDFAGTLTATFTVHLSADQFTSAVTPQTVTLDLDLDSEGGSGPTEYFEGFETGGFGTFTTMNLDLGRHNAAGSDGYRCQYSDPGNPDSNTYGFTPPFQCLLGATASQADAFWWRLDGPAAPSGGRSYGGLNSVHMGIDLGPAAGFTTPTGVLEAMALNDPINIGVGTCSVSGIACFSAADCSGGEDCLVVVPELSFKHQISLMDYRHLQQLEERETLDRGVVQVQLAWLDGAPVGDWITIDPYWNVHDEVPDETVAVCMFDPIDDGNDEETLFPGQSRLGPSSTCYAEDVFAYLGDTDDPYDPLNIGHASHGPGLMGATGPGTWVESRYDLGRFRGQRIRLRLLSTTAKSGPEVTDETWEDIFQFNPDPSDDGWWVDDVNVTGVLANPASVAPDVKDNSGLAQCADCSEVLPALAAVPPALPAPVHVSELDAGASVANACPNGVLQYQFWIDGDQNGLPGDPLDQLLRDWSGDPGMPVAPRWTTQYLVAVRCSSNTGCVDFEPVLVAVDCPNLQILAPATKDSFYWTSGAAAVDYVRGLFSLPPGNGVGAYNIQESDIATGANSIPALSEPAVPGDGYFYVVKLDGPLYEYCNVTWRSGGSGEVPEPARNAIFPAF